MLVLTEGLVEDWLLHQMSHPIKIKNTYFTFITFLGGNQHLNLTTCQS